MDSDERKSKENSEWETVIQPPSELPTPVSTPTVFLAGSIDMGAADDWQADVIASLDKIDCYILNPRRDNWDSSWEQSANNPNFKEQVDWELDGLDLADVIAFYFQPGSKSPVTMLELGLFAKSRKVIVCCPTGFYRKGNIDIVCQRENVAQVDSLESMIQSVRQKLVE